MTRGAHAAGVLSGGALALMLCALGACTEASGKTQHSAAADAGGQAAPRPTSAAPITDITDEHYQMPPLPSARVTVLDVFNGPHVVDAEVAATKDSRTRGLMWRTQLADGKGMLFIFSEQQPLSFWMRNTLISLDMLFIDKASNVVGIVEQAEPRTLSSRGVGKPSLYVLEVPGGWAAKHGVKAGSKVRLEGLADIAVEP